MLTFYTDPDVRAVFKAHVSALTSRVNSRNGVAYKDDETILGWDVINEPRCPGAPGAAAADRRPSESPPRRRLRRFSFNSVPLARSPLLPQ